MGEVKRTRSLAWFRYSSGMTPAPPALEKAAVVGEVKVVRRRRRGKRVSRGVENIVGEVFGWFVV